MRIRDRNNGRHIRIYANKPTKEIDTKREDIKIDKIKVIDAPCGAGKTSWAIQEMKKHPDNAYIYCTPFLDEISRIRSVCGQSRFQEPTPYTGTKIDDFNNLLSSGSCIAVSHVTFLNATQDTLERIRGGKYTLILDEALDVICDFNSIKSVEDAPIQSVQSGDIEMLLNKKLVSIGEDYKVNWIGGEYGKDFKFYEVMRLANLNQLYCSRGKLFVTVFPPEMFRLFENIYVLTYMFDGCLLKPYYDMFHLEYELMSIEENNGEYSIIPYCSDADIQFRRRFGELMTICDTDTLHRRRTLSKSWYSGASKEELKQLKNDLYTYFHRVLKGASAKNGDIMWTCPTDYHDALKGSGFTCSRRLTSEDMKLSPRELDQLQKQLSCFVPCNAKATNEYQNRWALAYCYNMHLNPMIEGFLFDCGIAFDENLFSLGCLLQWICRSRIRNGLEIHIYIPSKRMRDLLKKWISAQDDLTQQISQALVS